MLFFGYQGAPYIQGSMGTYTRPDFSVSNMSDPFAVSIMNDGEIVGHMPRQISAACALFSLAASLVNSVNVSPYSYLAKGMEYWVFSFS